MIQILIAITFIVGISIVMCYILTLLPGFWSTLIMHIDKKVETEVERAIEKKISERQETLIDLEKEINKKKQKLNEVSGTIREIRERQLRYRY